MPKVRHFMWRAVKNWLACRGILSRKKCGSSPLCPICESEVESIEHMLFRCSWTKAVWFGSGRLFWIFDGRIDSVEKWMFELLCGNLSKESPEETIGDIFQICWAIWKARNEFVFQGHLPNPESVILKANLASKDYLNAIYSGVKSNLQGPSRKLPRSERWCPPPNSVFKVNSDGAYSSSRSVAVFGVVVRDCGGIAQFWRVGKAKVSSALAIEAWALRIACGMALDLQLHSVIFESDCKVLIDCLTKPYPPCPWEISAIMDDIKSWASSQQWSFSWCCREQNKVAHWLASTNLHRSFYFDSSCVPHVLNSLIDSDIRV